MGKTRKSWPSSSSQGRVQGQVWTQVVQSPGVSWGHPGEGGSEDRDLQPAEAQEAKGADVILPKTTGFF